MTHKVTSENEAVVEALCSVGTPHTQIAKAIGVSKMTLYKYYQDILDTALIMKNAKVANSLFYNATEKMNVTAQIFWLKCQSGWKEAAEAHTEDEQIEKIEISVVKANKEEK